MPKRSLLLALIAATLAESAAAQFVPPLLQPEYANPGARSTGFGGAFVALADDATAAFSNPAGLVQLSRMEISLELRAELDLDAGSADGDGGNQSASAVGFGSFVYPWKKLALAIYRHDLADARNRVTTSGGGPTGSGQVLGASFVDASVVGLAAGYSLREGLSLGLGVARYSADVDGIFVETLGPAPDGDLARVSFLEGSGSDVVVSAGLLWDFAPSWRLGASYRQGPDLEADFSGDVDLGADDPGARVLAEGTPIGFGDTFGLGLAWRTKDDRWTLSGEWNRILFSRLLSSLDPTLFDTAGWRLDDGDQLHLGAEYVFLQTTPVVALRMGAWREELAVLRPRAGGTSIENASGNSLEHLSGGVGVAFRKAQLDLGIDRAEDGTLVSLTFVKSF